MDFHHRIQQIKVIIHLYLVILREKASELWHVNEYLTILTSLYLTVLTFVL